MRGFNPQFTDPPDYILKITREIWEDRRIHALNDYYAPDIHIRAPAGLVTGNRNVIAATIATLAEFPDRQLLGEDVIWCGDGEGGFLSSHRLLSTATHLGDGAYGPASGTRFCYRIIADCAARENQIYDEWIVRDQGAIVRQMGADPKRFAADQIEREGGPETCVKPLTPATDGPSVYAGTGNTHELGMRYASILTGIMNADMATVAREYDRAVHLELPGGETAHGSQAADHFWMSLRSAFPSAVFSIHHQIGLAEPGMPGRAALRWSLQGRHDGWGAFGPPTGAEVHIMGISHAEFGHWGLRREFIALDETAVWKQILMGG